MKHGDYQTEIRRLATTQRFFRNKVLPHSRTMDRPMDAVIDARKKYPELSLVELYEAASILPELVKAHQKLDKAVEAAYVKPLKLTQTVSLIYSICTKKLTKGLFTEEPKKGKTKKVKRFHITNSNYFRFRLIA